MQIDHLAVTCADLDAGAAWVEAALGVRLQPGGRHALFGTHNQLLGLGSDLYLEVIAPDPAAPAPERPRWFGLDRAGAPSLANWIARTQTFEGRPETAGDVLSLARGDLSWEITVPADGNLTEGGAFPSLIRWLGDGHPATRLPDSGVRLLQLEISTAEPARIAGLMPALDDPRVVFRQGPARLRAQFATAGGTRWLG